MALPELKEFCLPESSEELAGVLDKYGENALIVAGGTFVHGLEARGFLPGVEALVDLRNLGLDQIQAENSGVRVGATVKFADLDSLPGIDTPAFGALRDTLTYPPTQIKNLATVGGSIASSCPFYDVPAAYQVLDGVVTVAGQSGNREAPVQDIYDGLFENSLEADEYIASLFLPDQSKRAGSAYIKLETNANDLALVGVAVRITLGSDSKIDDARVVLGGGLNDVHVRSGAAEAALNGQKAGDEVFQRAAEAITGDISPISDHRCSGEYRATVGRVYVKRALQQAVERIG